MRPLLGWLPLEVKKCTFECTTQLAMGSMIRLPFRQHYKSRTPQLNLFTGTKSKLTKVFKMQTKSEGPDALEDFICDN
eukprot:6483852-Ditylum_brightwellii.AAC.1